MDGWNIERPEIWAQAPGRQGGYVHLLGFWNANRSSKEKGVYLCLALMNIIFIIIRLSAFSDAKPWIDGWLAFYRFNSFLIFIKPKKK